MRPQPDYAATLRAAMDHAGVSRNRLAPLFAEQTGNQRESEYRALGKYLSGDELPSRERAATLAVLLGEPAVALVPLPAERRQGHLEELAEAIAEVLANQREALGLLRSVTVAQPRVAAPKRKRS